MVKLWELTGKEMVQLLQNAGVQVAGVYMKKEFAETDIPRTYSDNVVVTVINLSDDVNKGTHWVALFQFPRRESPTVYFDSYGGPPPEIFNTLKKQGVSDVIFNNFAFQQLKSVICGWYLVAVAHITRGCKDSDQFMRAFLDKFDICVKKDDKKFNDNFVSKYIAKNKLAMKQ